MAGLLHDYDYQLKFVIDSPADCESVEAWLAEFERIPAEHVWLTQPGLPARQAQAQSMVYNGYAFDGLEHGVSYGVLIDDPRLEGWSQSDVQPGETLRPQLRGNAAVSVRILQPDQALYTGPYRLSIEKFATQLHDNLLLVSANEDPPTDGRVSGLVPGDYEFELSVAGLGAHRVVVTGLAAFETRGIEVSLSLPVGIQGRVLASDGTSPMAGVDVQLTRGEVAGHTLAPGSTIYSAGLKIPYIDMRTTTDAHGRFEFEGLQPGPRTVRAMWSDWLIADQTHVLPLADELEFVQPPWGLFAGQLLLPAGAPIEDSMLWITPLVEGMPPAPHWLPAKSSDSIGLDADGSFLFGPLPVGEIDVGFMVTTDDVGENGGSSGSGPHLGRFTIGSGPPPMQVLDVRSSFPGRVHGSVSIDGIAASGGSLKIQSLPPAMAQHQSNKLSITGRFRYGGLYAGSEQSLKYTSPSGWSWSLPETIGIAAGSESEFSIEIATLEREIQIVDASTLLSLPQQRIAWRTGADFAATQDPPGELEHGGGRSDAQGKLRVRLPLGSVRFVALPSGSFSPASMEWSEGAAPIVLRFTPAQ